MVPALLIWLILGSLATGQLEADFEEVPEYEYSSIIPSEVIEAALSKDYSPLQNEKARRFLEGLIIEAGRHVLFPELYIPNEVVEEVEDSSVRDPKFYEVRGQPEFEQTYLNKKRGGRSECPEDCIVYKPVCGSDGKVYPSECHLLRENCGSPNVSKGPWDKCRGKHYLCPSRCLDISDPVCASDGRIYHNVCIMRKRNCGKLLQVLPVKKCYEDLRIPKGSTACPEKCPEISKPVCGSNGVIYFNECFMRMQTCRQGIVEVEMASCVYIPKCPEVCLAFHDPVCGSDGRLYINQCRMMQTNCGKDVKKMPNSFCSSAV